MRVHNNDSRLLMIMIISDALDTGEQINEESNALKDKKNTFVEAIKSKI